MRRLIWAAVGVVALLGAGIAVAHEGESKSVIKVSTQFTAGTGADVRTSTCTGSDGTYVTTRGRWTGTAVNASGDAALNGNVTIDAQALVNTTTGVGTVEGRLRIDTSDGKHTGVNFDAVYSGGHVTGLAEGRGSSGQKLIANLSADWASATGFQSGKLGGGTAGGDAVELSPGGCRPAPQPKPETIQAHGAVSLGANNATVTVAGVTCNVPSNLASAVGSLHNGDRIEIKCLSASGTNTLLHVSGERRDKQGKHHNHDD
jgi:hypothetical protein